MSKYTTQLRWIVEQIGQGLDVPEGQEYANAVYKYIGLSKYPIFDESYRSKLNDKIIDHYFFREIGQETAAQFAFMVKRTMQEVMPKYNRIYEAMLTEMSHPLSDYTRHRDIVEDFNSDVDTISTVNSNGTAEQKTDGTVETNSQDHNRNVFQDTPMSLLSNSGSPSIEDLDYATTVTYDDGTGNNVSESSTETDSKSSTTTNGTVNSERNDNRNKVEDVYGRNKSLAAIIDEFNDKFVDIDVLVIGELEDLFFKLW